MSDWRDTYEYRLWRWAVISRDRRCVICNAATKLHAHHVNHATYFVDQRFDVDNGVSLCGACHMNYHCNFHRSYRTLCDEYNFMNFVHLSTHFHGLWNETMCSDSLPYDVADCLLPNSCKLSLFSTHQFMAYIASPDSVVGYVAELATLRYPE